MVSKPSSPQEAPEPGSVEKPPKASSSLKQEDAPSTGCCRNNLVLLVILGVLAIVNAGALVGIYYAVDAKKDSSCDCDCNCPADVTSPHSEANNLDDSVLPFYNLPASTQKALEDPESPQSLAFHWLSNHPDLDSLEEWRKRQLFALVTFYYSFRGELWPADKQRNWLDYSVHECDWVLDAQEQLSFWYHNTCDSKRMDDGQYVPNIEYQTLFLNDVPGLDGTMPPEIAFLTSLYGLGIFQCPDLSAPLSAVLPPPEMSSLSYLHFFENDLSGTIPSYLGLMELSGLDLHGNRLFGNIPSELNLRYKDDIFLHDNNLVGTVPSELCSLDITVDCAKVNCPDGCGCVCHDSANDDDSATTTTTTSTEVTTTTSTSENGSASATATARNNFPN